VGVDIRMLKEIHVLCEIIKTKTGPLAIKEMRLKKGGVIRGRGMRKYLPSTTIQQGRHYKPSKNLGFM
jgi:hypothetical protein